MKPDVQPSVCHRKVYARGYYDGLRAAGIKPNNELGGKMNAARLQSIVKGLTGVSRKVFEMVPINEAWSVKQIHTEASRTGHRMDVQIMTSCLNQLVEQKLIGEPTRGYFKKDQIKQEKKDMQQPKATVELVSTQLPPKAPPPNPKTEKVLDSTPSPILIIGQISTRVTEIIGSLTGLLNELDSAAITIEDQLAESEGKNEKLKQLQQLLKSLG